MNVPNQIRVYLFALLRSVVRPSIDVNITWLMTNIDESAAHKPRFAIDRLAKSCHTPRRNEPIDAAFTFLTSLYVWCNNVNSYITNTLMPVQADHGLDLRSIQASALFVPVVPLFEKSAGGAASSRTPRSHKPHSDKKEKKEKKEKRSLETSLSVVESAAASAAASAVLPADYVAPFAAEQARSIREKFKELTAAFPANDKLVTVAEAKLCVVLQHVRAVCQAWADGIDYIEDMLRKQLIAAIGTSYGSLPCMRMLV